MDIDNINNSQLILLVFLVTIVVSAATSLVTLSTIVERIESVNGVQTEQSPTVVQQTINRIIERVPAIIETKEDTQDAKEKVEEITLDEVRNSIVTLNYGSQPITTGIFVSNTGKIIVPLVLEEKRRYSVIKGEEVILFAVDVKDENYSLLSPIEEYSQESSISLTDFGEIGLGQSALILGGSGDYLRLFSEIVSRKEKHRNGFDQIRTSVLASDIVLPSVVFVDNKFVGFASNYSGWIPVISKEIISFEKIVEEKSAE